MPKDAIVSRQSSCVLVVVTAFINKLAGVSSISNTSAYRQNNTFLAVANDSCVGYHNCSCLSFMSTRNETQ